MTILMISNKIVSNFNFCEPNAGVLEFNMRKRCIFEGISNDVPVIPFQKFSAV